MKSSIDEAVISFDESADLIAESKVLTRIDLGYALMLRLEHPSRGVIVVLSSSIGKSAVMKV